MSQLSLGANECPGCTVNVFIKETTQPANSNPQKVTCPLCDVVVGEIGNSNEVEAYVKKF